MQVLTSSGPFVNLNRVVYISFGFLVLFTAFIACQNLTSKIMSDLGYSSLGTVNIAVIYLAFAMSSTLASTVITKLGVRCTLTVSSFTYVTWILSFILPAYKYERK